MDWLKNISWNLDKGIFDIFIFYNSSRSSVYRFLEGARFLNVDSGGVVAFLGSLLFAVMISGFSSLSGP